MKRYEPWNGGEMIVHAQGKFVLVEDVRKMMQEVIDELRKLQGQMKTPGS